VGVNYDKLFKLLDEQNITTRMRRNEYISLESIEKICRTLSCHVDDILDFE